MTTNNDEAAIFDRWAATRTDGHVYTEVDISINEGKGGHQAKRGEMSRWPDGIIVIGAKPGRTNWFRGHSDGSRIAFLRDLAIAESVVLVEAKISIDWTSLGQLIGAAEEWPGFCARNGLPSIPATLLGVAGKAPGNLRRIFTSWGINLWISDDIDQPTLVLEEMK